MHQPKEEQGLKYLKTKILFLNQRRKANGKAKKKEKKIVAD